jgi:phosphoglycerate dehydrogenase-like enzyme
MKPNAVLINVARGDVLDEEALVSALENNVIGGAALDVYQEEPLPPGNKLWSLPNVILSPHIAGHSPHYRKRAVDLFCENLRRYLANEDLLNLVERERGY